MAEGLFGPGRRLRRKNVGVPPNQLVPDGVRNISGVEMPLLPAKLGLKYDLEQKITELFLVVVHASTLEGVDDLVCLFNQVGFQRSQGLLVIPRAAAGPAEPGHDGDETLKST